MTTQTVRPRLAMIAGDETTFAEDFTTLVERLASEAGLEYGAGLDQETAFLVRAELAERLASHVQGAVVAEAVNTGRLQMTGLDEEATTVLLGTRVTHHDLAGLGLDPWTHDVDLIMVATHFEPYTEGREVPARVLLIDPYSDTTLITSLNAIGAIRLMVNEESDADPGVDIEE